MMKKYLIIGLLLVASFGAGFLISSFKYSSSNALLKESLNNISIEKEKIEKEKTELTSKINSSLESAESKEKEVQELNSILAQNRRNLSNEKQKLQKATETFNQEISNISIPTDNYSRCIRLCSTRAELGFACVPDFCSQFK